MSQDVPEIWTIYKWSSCQCSNTEVPQEWKESDAKIITNSEEVKLRSFSTGVHKYVLSIKTKDHKYYPRLGHIAGELARTKSITSFCILYQFGDPKFADLPLCLSDISSLYRINQRYKQAYLDLYLVCRCKTIVSLATLI